MLDYNTRAALIRVTSSRVGIAAVISEAGPIVAHDHLVGSLEEVIRLTDLNGQSLSIDDRNFARGYGITALWVHEALQFLPLADPLSLAAGGQVRIVAPSDESWTELAGELIEAPAEIAVSFVRPLVDVPLSRIADSAAAVILTLDGALAGMTYAFSERSPFPDLPAGLLLGYPASAIAEFLRDVLEH